MVTPLRAWLRRQPHPNRLRVDGRDVAIATGSNHWAKTEETVLAMDPSKVEALDSTGGILRVTTLRDDDELEEERAKPQEESEVVQIARLLNEAHDAGARRHADAYKAAFEENTNLVRILAERLGGLEAAWQQAMQQSAQAQADAILAAAKGSEDEDAAGAAIKSLLAGALVKQTLGGAKATNGTNGANGATKKKGA